MPKTFRVTGQVRVPFIHETEADSAASAETIVENTRLDGLDDCDFNMGMTEVGEVVELDEEGNEIEEVESNPYTVEDLVFATSFLTSMEGLTSVKIRSLILNYVTDENIVTPRSFSKLHVLTVVGRQLRTRAGMNEVTNALKELILERD